MKRYLIFLLCIVLTISYLTETAQAASEESDSVQHFIDTELTSGAGSTSEWYIIALSQSDKVYDYSSYVAALTEYLNTHDRISAVTEQKYALALIAAGAREHYKISEIANRSLLNKGIMSWIFELHLLNNVCVSTEYDITEIIDRLEDFELEDGGFALTGITADADVTAMAIQAMAPCYKKSDKATEIIDRAVECLSAIQLADGDYQSFGEANPESAAQVIIALTAIGIDCLNDGRFIKNGKNLLDGINKYKLEEGGYSHVYGGEEELSPTVQCFCALTALERLSRGRGSLYVFDADEPLITVEPYNQNSTAVDSFNYKPVVQLTIAALALLLCIYSILKKRRGIKNYLLIVLSAAILIILVQLLNIRSAEEYYGEGSTDKAADGAVTMTIRCDTIKDENNEYVPKNGIILDKTEFAITEGDTVYDILVSGAKKYRLQLEASSFSTADTGYVKGIAYIYEFDFGELSGWLYFVNGETPSCGCKAYVLKDGDSIEWCYSKNIGLDLKEEQLESSR